ncbi:MAG: hypothetical protein ACTSYF_09750 [Promethearchaeota archaeon]
MKNKTPLIENMKKMIEEAKMINPMPIEEGLALKIYLLAYDTHPKSGYEIAMEIYGHDHHRVRTTIKELAKEGYFIPIEKDEWRWPRWISSVEPIIKRVKEIKQIKNIELTDFDIHVLRKILDSEIFREHIQKHIDMIMPRNMLRYYIDLIVGKSAIDFILEEVEVFFIINRDIKEKAKLSNEKEIFEGEVKTIEEFDKLLKAYTWLKSLPHERLSDIPEGQHEYFEFLWHKLRETDMYAFFPINLPEDTLERLKGISSFGRKYEEIKGFINGMNGKNTRSSYRKG